MAQPWNDKHQTSVNRREDNESAAGNWRASNMYTFRCADLRPWWLSCTRPICEASRHAIKPWAGSINHNATIDGDFPVVITQQVAYQHAVNRLARACCSSNFAVVECLRAMFAGINDVFQAQSFRRVGLRVEINCSSLQALLP